MDNFIYSIPTTAYFGKGQINILGEKLGDCQYKFKPHVHMAELYNI